MNTNALQEMDYAERQYLLSNGDDKVVSWMESCERTPGCWESDATMEMDSSLMTSDEEREHSPSPQAEVVELRDYCRKVQAPAHLYCPIYSRVLQYLEVDFLNCSLPMVIAATADFHMSSS